MDRGVAPEQALLRDGRGYWSPGPVVIVPLLGQRRSLEDEGIELRSLPLDQVTELLPARIVTGFRKQATEAANIFLNDESLHGLAPLRLGREIPPTLSRCGSPSVRLPT